MQTPFEMQTVHLDDKDVRCVVWYDSYYDMYCGATMVDDQLGIVSLIDCHTYSSSFRAKPHLVSLCFGTVRDLFQLLYGTRWRSFISDPTDRQIVITMRSRLLRLRQHWSLNGYHADWIESTAELIETG